VGDVPKRHRLNTRTACSHLVDRADGTTARFVVTGQGKYTKAAFPSDLVYYPTLEPELRLVTCGGPIDVGTGHYSENLVVFAAQAS
jgi:hypothetical protein